MMMTKKELSYYSSLLKKKYRSEEKKFLSEGKKIVDEGIANSDWIKKLEIVFATDEFIEKENEWVKKILYKKVSGDKIKIIKNSEFKKISDTVNPQGITAVFKMASAGLSPAENELVCLENISDPGNVGTIIRNCDWFGLKEVILGAGCAEIYNPKTIRSSAGSIFNLNFLHEVNHLKFLLSLKDSDYRIITADIDGKSIYSFNPPEKFILVFSNEANGPSGEVIRISDEIVAVPKTGRAESLNVSSAAAVILGELSRRKNIDSLS